MSMAKDEFFNMEMVNIFTALDGGGVESVEGFVVQADKNRVIARSGFQEYMTFMYSAPDDMWLRVVPEGGSVVCTRLEKIKSMEEPAVISRAYPNPPVIIDDTGLAIRKALFQKLFRGK